jgi:hypothetical protein
MRREDGQGFDFANQRTLSQSAVSAWVCLISAISAKSGAILDYKAKEPDINLCHACRKNAAALVVRPDKFERTQQDFTRFCALSCHFSRNITHWREVCILAIQAGIGSYCSTL